jgi:hypothetical protein
MNSLATNEWWGARAEQAAMTHFGIRIEGGGAHQSKTMMFEELDALLSRGGEWPTVS